MNERTLDWLMDDVVAEIANPAVAAGFARKMAGLGNGERSRTMHVAATGNVLEFGAIERVGGFGMSRSSVTAAALVNLAAMLLLMVQMGRVRLAAPKPVMEISLVEPQSLAMKKPPKLETMGGGGGQPGAAPVSRGNPPEFAKEQLNPPKAPPLAEPKINVPVTVDVDPNVRMAKVDLANMGVPDSPNVGLSLGNGAGSGIGSGKGAGIGPGSGGGMGGGLRRIGGGVAAPVVLYMPEPEFSEEARKAKVSGNVLVYLQVDQQGRPTHVRVLRGIGLGLDQKAVEAVRAYKFKPAMEDGKAVAVEMNVEVTFQIF